MSHRHLMRLVALVMMACLLFTIVPAQAAGIRLSAHPQDQEAAEGGDVTFTVGAAGYTGLSWHLVSPNGSEDILAKNVASKFPGVTVSGYGSKKLTFKNVTADMNGWQVYCRISIAGTERKDTNNAHLWIEGQDHTPAESAAMEAVTANQAGSGDYTISAFGGCKITSGETTGLTSLSFSGSVKVKVVASKTPAYWVINGTRFDFKPVPKQITITGLSRSLTIEAVMSGKKSTTLLSSDEIQSMRTGETLTVSAGKGAQLCHLTSGNLGKGGWFRSFDFTNDFTNKATKRTETGGRVTVRVKGNPPEGKGIASYTFMGATWSFGTTVGQFKVTNLRESMRFDANFYELPKVTITGVNCHLYGGGYNDAVTVTVYEGTVLTAVGDSGTFGTWSGLKTTTMRKHPSLKFTAHNSGSIIWNKAQ